MADDNTLTVSLPYDAWTTYRTGSKLKEALDALASEKASADGRTVKAMTDITTKNQTVYEATYTLAPKPDAG